MGGSANNITGQDNFSFNPDVLSYQFKPNDFTQLGDTGQNEIAKGISSAASNIGSGIGYLGAPKPSASAANPTYDPANYVGGNNPMYQKGQTYTPSPEDWMSNQLQAKFQTPVTGLRSLDSGVSLQSVMNPYELSLPSYWR